MNTKNAKRWNEMTTAQRIAKIKKDPSMRSPRWAELVTILSTSKYEKLNPIQQGAADAFLTL